MKAVRFPLKNNQWLVQILLVGRRLLMMKPAKEQLWLCRVNGSMRSTERNSNTWTAYRPSPYWRCPRWLLWKGQRAPQSAAFGILERTIQAVPDAIVRWFMSKPRIFKRSVSHCDEWMGEIEKYGINGFHFIWVEVYEEVYWRLWSRHPEE